MDFNEIWVFTKVVECEGFSRASRLLGIPKSTVSSKVSGLEKRLGVTLIHRTTRRLRTTDSGREYYNACAQAFADLQDAEKRSFKNQPEPKGTLRISAPIQLGTFLLPELIEEFMKSHSHLRIELALSDVLVDLVQDGVDIAIRVGELSDSSMITRRIGSNTFHLFASASYLKARGSPKEPRELERHSCLTFSVLWKSQEWELENGKNQKMVSVNGTFCSNNMLALKRMACLGLGIALLPRFVCQREISDGSLVPVIAEWSTRIQPIYAVIPQQRYVAPKVRHFIDFLTATSKFGRCAIT